MEKIKRELDSAIKNQQWEEVHDLLDRHREFLKSNVSKTNDLLLHAVSRCAPLDIITQVMFPLPHINVRNERGNTVLHVAVMYKRWELVPVLLQHGADVNVFNCFNKSPLYYAAYNGATADVIPQLIPPHNINIQGKDGKTALHEAVRWKLWELVPVLLQYGADPSMLDSAQPDQPLLPSLKALCIATIRSHMPLKSDEAYEGLGLPGKLVAEVKLRPQTEDILKRGHCEQR